MAVSSSVGSNIFDVTVGWVEIALEIKLGAGQVAFKIYFITNRLKFKLLNLILNFKSRIKFQFSCPAPFKKYKIKNKFSILSTTVYQCRGLYTE
jgi:Ca2+/Na+ antiporter